MDEISNLPKCIRSSNNPENLSLTIKGVLVMGIIFLAKQAGFEAGNNDAVFIAEGMISIGAVMVTLYGAIRRIHNSRI